MIYNPFGSGITVDAGDDTRPILPVRLHGKQIGIVYPYAKTHFAPLDHMDRYDHAEVLKEIEALRRRTQYEGVNEQYVSPPDLRKLYVPERICKPRLVIACGASPLRRS